MSFILLGVLNIQAAGGAGLGGARFYYTEANGNYDLERDSSTGDFYATGWANVSGNKGRLYKFNSTLANQWTKQIDTGASSFGRGIALDSSGNVYINGGSGQSLFGGGLIHKYNSSGTLQWQKDVGSTAYPNESYALSVAGTNLVSIGIYYTGSNFYGPVNVSDLNGNQIRTNLFGANYYTSTSASDGTYHYTVGEDAFSQIPMIAALNGGGTGRLWHKEDASATLRSPSEAQISLSSSDVLISCRNRTSPYDAVFLRVSKSNGSLGNANRIVAPASGDSCLGKGYERDASGNYYYVAYGNRAVGGAAIYIIKTDSGNNVLWQRQITSTSSIYPTATAIDGSNLYIYSNMYDGTTNQRGIWAYPLDGSAEGTATLGTATITIEPSSATFTTQSGINWSTSSASFSGTPFAWNYATSSYTITSPTTTWNEVA